MYVIQTLKWSFSKLDHLYQNHWLLDWNMNWLKHPLQAQYIRPSRDGVQEPAFWTTPCWCSYNHCLEQLFLGLSVLTWLSSQCNLGGNQEILIGGSVQFIRSVVSDSLWRHESQHARPPCPSPTPRIYPNSCPFSGWCHQPSHPLSSPSPPAPNPSQHQGLFQWVNSLHEVAKVLEFQL